MNKKIIPLAALVAMAAGANVAQAVNVNSDGLGQVLLFPFYSAVESNDTYINIVNTTDQVKAVKVRFVEGMNSKEVLDFNLYLSPHDHWSAVVTAKDDGAMVLTRDTSCTVPALPAGGQKFNPVLFAGDSVDGDARTREGYVEVIEMGNVTGALATAATHIGSGPATPADCNALDAAWLAGGQWATAPDSDMTPNTGGLYGYGVLINVPGGTAAAYDAVALDDFNNADILHARPGNSSPALDDAIPVATVIDNATVVGPLTMSSGLDAVSAVIMHDTIANDYMLEPSVLGGTDWVITFPTKHDYVNGATVAAPFTVLWDTTTSEACEAIGIAYYDREEVRKSPSSNQFSPATPDGGFALCKEANVLTFNEADVLGARASGKLSANLDLNAGFDNGWASMDFSRAAITTPSAGDRLLTNVGATTTFEGLPVIGFAVQRFMNNTLSVNGTTVLSNYSGSVLHKSTRKITP